MRGLLDVGAQVELPTRRLVWTLLHAAAQNSSAGVVRATKAQKLAHFLGMDNPMKLRKRMEREHFFMESIDQTNFKFFLRQNKPYKKGGM